MASPVVKIARCPEHGLHGCRHTCFECGGPVEQVEMVPVSLRNQEHQRLKEALGERLLEHLGRASDQGGEDSGAIPFGLAEEAVDAALHTLHPSGEQGEEGWPDAWMRKAHNGHVTQVDRSLAESTGARRYVPATDPSKEEQVDDFNLCFNCGEITPSSQWTLWQREEGVLRPHRDDESDALVKCPRCGEVHGDGYQGAGYEDGTKAHLEGEKQHLLASDPGFFVGASSKEVGG